MLLYSNAMPSVSECNCSVWSSGFTQSSVFTVDLFLSQSLWNIFQNTHSTRYGTRHTAQWKVSLRSELIKSYGKVIFGMESDGLCWCSQHWRTLAGRLLWVPDLIGFQRKTLSQNKKGRLLMEMYSHGLTQRKSFPPGSSFLSKKAGMSSLLMTVNPYAIGKLLAIPKRLQGPWVST